MIRIRRYRVFLAFTVFAFIGLYYINNAGLWSGTVRRSSFRSSTSKDPGKTPSEDKAGAAAAAAAAAIPDHKANSPPPSNESKQPLIKDASPNDASPKEPFPQIKLPGVDDLDSTPLANDVPRKTPPAERPSATTEAIHWSKQPEFFPVPSSALIPIPSGRPAKIPRIQADFPRESTADRKLREERLQEIKDTFLRHWDGYKKYAWQHDELRPQSGGYKDPFAGWRATLVDSLDTLWIMDLKEEFEDAVNAVKSIDFTTTRRGQIPLFEVAIRYMGGLLAAYDISEHKYPVLLEKVIELGELLMSAFDTPNRMPLTHFDWRPSSQSTPRVATSRNVLAEIGTLSVEFSRLAQVSKDPKYYDAVARITNEFEAFQNKTQLPGLWPLWIDASGGCSVSGLKEAHSKSNGPSPSPPSASKDGSSSSEALKEKDKNTFGTDRVSVTDQSKPSESEQIRQKDDSTFGVDRVDRKKVQQSVKDARSVADSDPVERRELQKRQSANKPVDDCVKIGFRSLNMRDRFSLGGMADSVYEYLPKAFLVLGGRNDQYRHMHEAAMDATKENLLFRPMIQDEERKLLFTGSLTTDGSINETTGLRIGSFEPGTGHLECFSGAMFGLGGKIFNRPDDVQIGERLTDGCVWAYESQITNIMPETFAPVACKGHYDDPCKWNETLWWQAIDPNNERMVQNNIDEVKKDGRKDMDLKGAAKMGTAMNDNARTSLNKRQLDTDADSRISSGQAAGKRPYEAETDERPSKTSQIDDTTGPENAIPTNLKDYMQKLIKDRSLVPGIARYNSKSYLLRPEAIESVFYMYRITGKSSWREKGWKMFTGINQYTKVRYGNSAISDVTKKDPPKDDAAESFWLGETLKYFYMLFDEPEGEGKVSLDEWVFSTEAHPFRRGDLEDFGGPGAVHLERMKTKATGEERPRSNSDKAPGAKSSFTGEDFEADTMFVLPESARRKKTSSKEKVSLSEEGAARKESSRKSSPQDV